MYTVDKDQVVPLDAPLPDVGAPHPLILAGEWALRLAYYISSRDTKWYVEKRSRIWSDSDELCVEESFAILEFQLPQIHLFGMPSEQTICGHPLSGRGLKSFMTAEVKESSWINDLVLLDSYAQSPVTMAKDRFRHFVISFHDSTFECVAVDFQVAVMYGNMNEILLP